MNNAYTNTRIEYHILQSFPVTCLNRDDVGAPKTALVGGVTRARVSSQCWKRQVRLAMKELGLPMGTRTKLIGLLIARKCKELGASDEQANACGQVIEKIFIKEEKKAKGKKKEQEVEEVAATDDDNDTLLFLSPREVEIIAGAFHENGFSSEGVITAKEQKKQAAELAKLIGKPDEVVNAVDIALFGRMVAKAADMNVEAAASFAHAISTHRVSNEVEFFTALDDLQIEPGSAHMGSLEFNSATYYRYVSLDLGQLAQTLGEENLKKAIAAFSQALFVAVPNARQTTQSGASPWEFARVLVRKGQRLQVPFEKPVQKGRDGGYLQPSIEELKKYLDTKEKLFGSLFGKLGSYDWGEDKSFSIDALIAKLQSHVQ
ncbi:type I-E CRISPR-associated protein Cas7/Cse4/CasC [Ectothiorhodospira shaposhnikovii]|uniref:type I-E CRISPR-associated protein Cas7/Cse4/CasC n=1 Tax=Ectothiorhodospira shaposhnikovii TaxID=1054 RepID=UPI001EE98A98|nr:type I-E CRISPR-associated protein Cas7/Cse4/CasC [Ectothiorhodospira shaposhnikovii]MCG5511697.1 type I-E CRISPR-associated protein Cas7/Cse4/CasC [Ectothiorhodospira shaposhnikovii]